MCELQISQIFVQEGPQSGNVFIEYISHSLTQTNKGVVFHITTIKNWLILSPTMNSHFLLI